ncbi:MAG: ABC transporter substrate-binding protein, partial [Alphaproteobacteria bacterium]
MLDCLAKVTTSCLFIMPERLANVDPFTNITEAVGSGPYRFIQNEWVPGSMLAYARNADYVPRQEAPSMTAGGKVTH